MEDEALTQYVLSNYAHFLTRAESTAQRSVLLKAKAKAYGGRMDGPLLNWIDPNDPEVRRLLADGVPAFRRRARDRILSERKDEVILNRCPKCVALARTPQACLCPACNHTWYELRGT